MTEREPHEDMNDAEGSEIEVEQDQEEGVAASTEVEEGAPPQRKDRRPGATGAETAAEDEGDGTEVPPRTMEEIQALRAERDRLYEAWLRVTADFDNYRKRMERDRHEYREYALESLLRQLLPVLDNFERALDSMPPGLPKAFVEGMSLIHKQLRDVLFKQGLTTMETSGEIFDPHVHEAVETQVRTDMPHHQILGEMAKGYKLGKRILRPAMVKVSVRPEEISTNAEAEAPGGEDRS